VPSWNIHTAHVERVRAEEDLASLGVADVGCFAFGNVAPDVYVGYMVKDCSRKIEYRETHFADPGYVPEPRFWEFWDRYALPSAGDDGSVSDVTLGAWCHLVADHVYNHIFNAYIMRIGVAPGERTRVRKQGDFDLYGRTLDISLTFEPTRRLIGEAAAFPQYRIDEADVRAAAGVQAQIVQHNLEAHVTGTPTYDLIPREMFAEMGETVDALMLEGLRAYAAHGAQGVSDVRPPWNV